MTMKVLHVLNELKFSGAEIMYVDAAPELQRMGCDLSVLTTMTTGGEYAPYFERAGYKVYHKPYTTHRNYIARWKWYFDIIKFLKKEHYDVVHIHAARLRWGMSFCAWRAGTRSVYTFHNVFVTHQWYTNLWERWLRWSAKHIHRCKFQTISDSVYNNEKKLYNNDTTLVYNWYGNKRFYPAITGEKNRVRKELGLSENALVIISVGGCSHVKRHHDMIKALSIIRQKYNNVFYLHLGEGVTLEEEVNMAKSLNVSNNVRFCGNQQNVRKYLIASDIYVMPSRYEGIPITTIEAMACGIPAVLYSVAGLRDFNSESEQRALLIEEDVEKLASAIMQLYEDKRLAYELSNKAMAFVNRKFYLPTNIVQIYKLYQPKQKICNKVSGGVNV